MQTIQTTQDAIQTLINGNTRFTEGKTLQHKHMIQVKTTSTKQNPFAVILGCMDSRVPATLIFDQGIGDIFNICIAGNFVNNTILGSLELAATVTNIKLILIMGHNECSAIKSACDNIELGFLKETLTNIQPAIDAVHGFDHNRTSKNTAFIQAVSYKHVELTVEIIKRNSFILKNMVKNGNIDIVGAMYNTFSGKVLFYSEK